MKRFACILLSLLGSSALRAQEYPLPTPDAKVLGMGGVAMTSLSTAHALYANAAMALFTPLPIQISTSYYHQRKMDCYVATGYWRFDNDNIMQAGWRKYAYGKKNNDMSVDAAYSRRIGGSGAIGVTGRYLHLKRPESSVGALALDLSGAWRKPLERIGRHAELRIGAKISNIGAYLKKRNEVLPMNATAGAALDTYLSDAHEVTVAADIGYRFAPSTLTGIEGAIGAEYNLMQLLQLRGGYHFGKRGDYDPNYGSIGAGVRFLHLRLDFAYLFAEKQTPQHNTYCLSFGFDF